MRTQARVLHQFLHINFYDAFRKLNSLITPETFIIYLPVLLSSYRPIIKVKKNKSENHQTSEATIEQSLH